MLDCNHGSLNIYSQKISESIDWIINTELKTESYESNLSHLFYSKNNSKIIKRQEKKSLFICDYENCHKTYFQKYRLMIHKRTHVFISLFF